MKGRQIIRAVMAERKIGPKDFFGSRFPEHVAARRDAITRMHEAGFNHAAIGRLMSRHETTIWYWVDAKGRAKKNTARLALHFARKAQSRDSAEASL
jgi:hypothetical protein